MINKMMICFDLRQEMFVSFNNILGDLQVVLGATKVDVDNAPFAASHWVAGRPSTVVVSEDRLDFSLTPSFFSLAAIKMNDDTNLTIDRI